MKDARKRLLERLSSKDAREIGDAVVADKGMSRSFSQPALETAAEIKQWAAGAPVKKKSAGRNLKRAASSAK